MQARCRNVVRSLSRHRSPLYLAAAGLVAVLLFGCSDGGPDREGDGLTAASGPSAWCTDRADGEPPMSASCAAEASVAKRLESLRGDPDALNQVLGEMPKGGDLHTHLSGAIATEALIEWAKADALCVDARALAAETCRDAKGARTPGAVPIGSIPDPDLLAAWSMEGFEGTTRQGHDHFFETFLKFRAVTLSRQADMLARVTSNAATQHESYMEVMISLGVSGGGKLGTTHIPAGGSWDSATLEQRRTEILADPKLSQNVQAARKSLDSLLESRSAALRCDAPDADPGCAVEVRFIVQIVRDATRESVFGQLVHGFELGAADPRVVGVNLALAEDSENSLRYYDDDMRALEALNHAYGGGPVHIALHAGELVPELLPGTPEGQEHLTYHIRHAVELGQAERIGHGVDVLHESAEGESDEALRAEMAERHVLVELCLSSNDQILGVTGAMHPFSAYRASGVPLAIATDDEGVSRSSMTKETARAFLDQRADYPALKAMARSSLEYSFLPGESLWKARGSFEVRTECAGEAGASAACRALVDASERARLEWQLEDAFARFEKR